MSILGGISVALGAATVISGINEEDEAKSKSLFLVGIGGVLSGIGEMSFDYALEREREKELEKILE